MEIESLMDELEDMLDSAWHMPMSGGRILVNSNEIKRILEDIRLRFPKELIQAKNIVADRAKIIEDANKESEAMMKVAEERIKQMISREEIVKAAQDTACEVIGTAKAKAKEIKLASNDYAEGVMQNLDKTVTSYLSEIRKARQCMRSAEVKVNSGE